MRVFVTGAAGFIGRSVVQELRANGHQVTGLARNDANVEILTKLGAEIHRGNLEDLESLKAGAQAADGVIHLAFVHNFQDFANSIVVDRKAIEAMGEVLAGTGKALVIASGTMGLSPGKVATEDTMPSTEGHMNARYLAAQVVYDLSREKQVRGSVIRLSPVVHGKDDWGFCPIFIGAARKNGVAGYVGDGSARWPAVHKEDAAVLFRLALENGPPGSTYHAVAEEGISNKDIMTKIGQQLKVPVEGKTVEEAAQGLGMLANFATIDAPTSSEKTRKELGWKPSRITLMEDLEANYF